MGETGEPGVGGVGGCQDAILAGKPAGHHEDPPRRLLDLLFVGEPPHREAHGRHRHAALDTHGSEYVGNLHLFGVASSAGGGRHLVGELCEEQPGIDPGERHRKGVGEALLRVAVLHHGRKPLAQAAAQPIPELPEAHLLGCEP